MLELNIDCAVNCAELCYLLMNQISILSVLAKSYSKKIMHLHVIDETSRIYFEFIVVRIHLTIT